MLHVCVCFFVFAPEQMIIDEANKVVEWERGTELARREALQHAADVHGQGGASAAEAAKERGALVQAMMGQKANIMLLSTVGLLPAGYVCVDLR